MNLTKMKEKGGMHVLMCMITPEVVGMCLCVCVGGGGGGVKD